MKTISVSLFLTLAVVLGFAPLQLAGPLPEFGTSDVSRWLNSKPLTVEDLAGQVVLVEVWTFG